MQLIGCLGEDTGEGKGDFEALGRNLEDESVVSWNCHVLVSNQTLQSVTSCW